MKKIFPLLLIALAIPSFAQFPIPTFDVALKGGVNSDQNEYITIDIRLEANVHINQYVAVGFYYAPSVFGNIFDEVLDEDFDAKQLSYGGRLQASTGRVSKYRPYIFLAYSKMEIVQDRGDLRFAVKSNDISFGAGLMIKLSDRMYLNVLELEYRSFSEDLWFFPDPEAFLLSARIGVNYTIGKSR